MQGDLGTDFRGRPVAEILGAAAPRHGQARRWSRCVFEAIFGLLAGILAGIRKGSFFDNLVLVTTIVVVSIPVFVLGFLAQYIARRSKLGLFPIAGHQRRAAQGYLLPGFVLAALSLAYVARLTRTSLVENLRNDYVRTAQAKGLPPRTRRRQAHAAQQPHPGRHLPRRRPRRAAVAARSSPRASSTSPASAAPSSRPSARRRAPSSSAS